MIWLYKIFAALIVAWAIPSAFDPKYRYNEHMRWCPELWEVFLMVALGTFVVGAILI